MEIKGQVTVFVILAILLFAVIALVFILYQNQFSKTIGKTEDHPINNFEDCINGYVNQAADLVYANSGFIEMPTLTYLLTNTEGYYKQFDIRGIPYLCYTALDYTRCTPQAPLLISHLEKEIFDYIEPKIDFCFELVKNGLEEAGYKVNLENIEEVNAEVVKNAIEVRVKRKLTQSKSEFEETFDSFQANFRSPLYDIAKITEEIINQESLQCNANYIGIMAANKNFDVEKFESGNGVTIYTVTDMKTKKSWTFAIRGCVLSVPS